MYKYGKYLLVNWTSH